MAQNEMKAMRDMPWRVRSTAGLGDAVCGMKCEGNVLYEFLGIDVRDGNEFDVATEFSAAFKIAQLVWNCRSMPEFDGDVLLVCEDSTELNARGEENASVLDLFSKRLDMRFQQGANCDNHLKALFAQEANVLE